MGSFSLVSRCRLYDGLGGKSTRIITLGKCKTEEVCVRWAIKNKGGGLGDDWIQLLSVHFLVIEIENHHSLESQYFSSFHWIYSAFFYDLFPFSDEPVNIEKWAFIEGGETFLSHGLFKVTSTSDRFPAFLFRRSWRALGPHLDVKTCDRFGLKTIIDNQTDRLQDHLVLQATTKSTRKTSVTLSFRGLLVTYYVT